MMDIKQNRLRETEEGKLIAGFRWREPIIENFGRTYNFYATLWIVGIVGMVLMTISYASGLTIFFVLGSIILAVIFIIVVRVVLNPTWTISDQEQRSNGVHFNNDGDVFIASFPPFQYLKKPAEPKWIKLKFKVDDISSIERNPTLSKGGGHLRLPYENSYFSYDVMIHHVSGASYFVGTYLSDEESRVIVVQLMQALHEIRAAEPYREPEIPEDYYTSKYSVPGDDLGAEVYKM